MTLCGTFISACIYVYADTILSKSSDSPICVDCGECITLLELYELIELTGNVATGILQGLRAILVYAISHVWYCHEDSAQCKFYDIQGMWFIDCDKLCIIVYAW
ncbi:uncharacterized protein EV154DRAFT_489153 [Mucor mucedo]|uniref:uncharacterized protein n=1 Tax=Mucor mucedo TaxID=29922 RepID=UPI0022208F23|nr:uncharacterized protein EV154DRAFT_489153 [Mucor mucedo]KAI7862779.1 hypothetical protein EV154DRAFT_489153 [Mucor mucedo]